ncbi:phage virion morphogenesis protein [Shewanella sp. D64]|uniref:phage virion morphogenesis protein n=1 Tax=unclassified Shewanella TaxID=196818 RepID=UPI0022BA1524|nr:MULTISPECIES: phage virion morphogenesis protein [unclassified Shewanella]MEC4729001.1 phage virion morphogenesis protein [Shewanella sp. D64]MEC4740027.1 phage virion morphogenesis protein [Shewanella sp. E94]WBJ94383.1 phage virion morphogenesis protein [Shewanella sp. MTB7]
MKLTTPEHLTAMLEGMALSPSQALALNRTLANRSRQFFRAQIRQQRDIDGTPYQPRSSKRGTRSRLAQKEVFNTKSASNMLMGLSRSLQTYATNDGFEVGLTGLAAKIGREHNEGATLSFTTRINGFYNSRTHQWEGGRRQKNNYRMAKRTFIGWTPSLERELMAMMSAELLKNVEG